MAAFGTVVDCNFTRGIRRLLLMASLEGKMKNILISVGLVLLFGSATQSAAQVKRVEMHIAGYLCGN